MMRFLCTLTTLFSLIAASVSASNAPVNPQLQLLSKLTMVTVTSTRGGGKKSPSAPADSLFRAAGNMFSSKEVQMLSDILHPSNIAKAASDFLQEQSTAARQRRDFYQSNADDAPFLSIFQPIRLLKLTLAAFLLSEVIDFIGGNTKCRTFYSNTLRPMVSGSLSEMKGWWKKGREKGGLFCASTWSQSNMERKPQIIVQAWNRQFSPKSQRAMGTALGLIFSPALWALTGLLGSYMAVAVVLAEINHYTGERLELGLRKVSTRLSDGWGKVDVGLERVRTTARSFIKKPTQMAQVLMTRADEQIPEEVLPAALQQGLLLGAVLGFVAGA